MALFAQSKYLKILECQGITFKYPSSEMGAWGDYMLKNMDKMIPYYYVVFRVIVGIVLAIHGYGKLFAQPGIAGFTGMLSGMGLPAAGFFAVLVGLIEFVGGICIAVGLFTRLAAILGGIVMIVALLFVHFPQGINPLANGGEAALLNLAAFLVMKAYGAGKWSLEKALWKKEMF